MKRDGRRDLGKTLGERDLGQFGSLGNSGEIRGRFGRFGRIQDAV